MVNLNKIKALCKEKGWNLSFLSKKLSLAPSYFTDVKNGKTNISESRLIVIADLLDTTVEYLKDETDIKEKSSMPSDDQVKVALFGGDEEVTDEMWEEVKNFVEFVKGKNKK